jgi:hypothetical protein
MSSGTAIRPAAAKPPPADEQSAKVFENAVRAILTTFGIFVGVAVKAVIDEIDFSQSTSWTAILSPLNDSHLLVAIAAIALLLRFVVGSAVHLNLCYVIEPRSKLRLMLFKDLAFLIVFGLFAIFMIKAKTVGAFEVRAFYFVAVGLIWSALDFAFRYGKTEPGEQSLLSLPWIGIDICQLALILAVWYWVSNVWWQSMWLAAGFTLALLGDMLIVLGAKKPGTK